MSQDIDVSKTALQRAFSFKENFKSIYTRRASNYASIDGIRAISIILVLVFHTFFVYQLAHPTHDVAAIINELGMGWAWAFNGDKGVDVFFVMSGFLISGILFRQIAKSGHMDLKNFYIRRYLRLTPAYYFTLTIYWLLNGPNSDYIWANYLYISNFIDYGHQAVGWTWSLAIEEQFYFIYPLLLIVILKYSKSPGYTMLWLFVISIIIRAGIVLSDEALRTSPGSRMYLDHDYFNHFFTVLYDNLHSRFGSLLVGCMAAYNFHFHKDKLNDFFNSTMGLVTTITGLILVIFFMTFAPYLPVYDEYQTMHILYYIFNRNLFSAGVGIIIIAMLLQQHGLANAMRKILSVSFLYPFATLSYSLYLIHLVVMAIVIPALINLTIMMPEQYPWSMAETLIYGFIVSSILSMSIATLMYLFIEKPIMNLRR
ncbi:MAG: acyltransferase [Methylophaga sp.]|nr:acyltransferase [Methylophaga sp.]